MKVAVFPSAYQPSVGGVEELSRQLAMAYGNKGHQVAIYTNRWPRSLPKHEVLDGIDVFRLPFRLPHPSLRGRLSYPTTNRLVTTKLNRLLRAQGADLIHVQCVSSNTLYAMRASQILSLPVVVTTQGELTMDADQSFQRGVQLPALLRRAANDADAFTACSAKTLADVEGFLNTKIDGACVVHNGTDVPTFSTAEPLVTGPYVLAIGRFAPQKGFDLLLEAWAKLSPGGVRLLLVGSGAEDGRLRAMTTELDIEDSVEFFGPADRTITPRLFAGATAVVIPSRADEGLPLVSIEAMASGRAFVATVSGGIREAVTDGVEGFLVPREDVEALRARLELLLADDALRTRMGEAGRRRAQQFDWDLLADRYLAVFDRVVSNR